MPCAQRGVASRALLTRAQVRTPPAAHNLDLNGMGAHGTRDVPLLDHCRGRLPLTESAFHSCSIHSYGRNSDENGSSFWCAASPEGSHVIELKIHVQNRIPFSRPGLAVCRHG